MLADTIHNFADALTAIPLAIAFILGRKVANRTFNYGYGRAEDIAGVIIVGFILASAIAAAYVSIHRLVNPQPLHNAGWVIVASIAGFLGNEGVAIFRIRVGRQIGSGALIADGQHARTDGLTSLAVLFGTLGVLLGFPMADPIVGLLISLVILFMVKGTATAIFRHLLDGVEPETVTQLGAVAVGVQGVERVVAVNVRWTGHKLRAEIQVVVDENLTTRESHHIAEEVRHALFHATPQLADLTVHVDPCGHGGEDQHALSEHHFAPTK